MTIIARETAEKNQKVDQRTEENKLTEREISETDVLEVLATGKVENYRQISLIIAA